MLNSNPLPTVALNHNFRLKGPGIVASTEFTLKSGPRINVQNRSLLSLVFIFLNTKMLNHVLNVALVLHAESPAPVELTMDLLRRYVFFIVASGIISMKRERLYFHIPKELQNWIKPNPFLSETEYRACKQYFIGMRPKMTDIFNEISRRMWTPAR